MIEVASREAIALIDEFESDVYNQERLVLYLTEAPIGDEYEYLSSDDLELGEAFEAYCKERLIPVWYRGNDPKERGSCQNALIDLYREIKEAQRLLARDSS